MDYKPLSVYTMNTIKHQCTFHAGLRVVRHNNITVLKPAHLPLAKAASRVHSSVAIGLRVVRHNNEIDTAINTVMIASVDTKKLQSH